MCLGVTNEIRQESVLMLELLEWSSSVGCVAGLHCC